MLVLNNEKPFVLGLCTAEQWLHANGIRSGVWPLDPVGRAAAEVVPFGTAGHVTDLARTELFKIIRGCHPAGVEEILVLPDAAGAPLLAPPLSRGAIKFPVPLITPSP